MTLAARLVVAVMACGPVPPAAAPQQAPGAGVRTKVQEVVTSGKAPSIAAAVGRGDRVIWSVAFGLADKARGLPATAAMPYAIASITKPFTATAVMILRERGLLSLDDPLSRHLGPLGRPGVRSDAEVTVGRTLGHIAGFPSHHQFFFVDEPWRPLPFAQRMQCFGAEVEEPGARVVYSNLGFGALSELIARVGGQPYGAFLRSELFEPLGLVNSRVPGAEEETAGAATRYDTDDEPLPFYVTDHDGASAVYASVEDLVRFGLFHAGTLTPERPILSRESRALMQERGLGNRGLGWSINPDWSGHRVVWHSGAMPGASATLWIVPDEGIAVAVAANQFGAPVNQLAGEILSDVLKVQVPTGSGPPVSDEAPGQKRQAEERAPDVRGLWRGSLGSCPDPVELQVDIRAEDDLTIALGSSEAKTMKSSRAARGRVRGAFDADVPQGLARFEFDLRARGDRLEGPLTRTIRLGPRGSQRVTLWASLARDKRSSGAH